MAKQVWYPENGDEVRLADGRVGKVTDDTEDPVSTGEGSWQVQIEFDDSEDAESDVEVVYNEREKAWEEVEA